MSKSILIIDDSNSIRQMVGLVLKGAGYKVVDAANGKEGLDQLNGQVFDLIVSDVNMPVMDGLTFVAEAKKLDNYRTTPILMLTTESEGSVKEKGRELGVKAWLVKPFQPPMLLTAVNKLT